MNVYLIQTRKRHGKWQTRYTVSSLGQAYLYYRSLNTFGDYRKRLVANGEIVAKQTDNYPWAMA